MKFALETPKINQKREMISNSNNLLDQLFCYLFHFIQHNENVLVRTIKIDDNCKIKIKFSFIIIIIINFLKMMQALIAIFCLLMLILTWFIWPIYRHYRNTNQEREQLEKRYNRLWRSRRDLLVSFHLILNLYFFII